MNQACTSNWPEGRDVYGNVLQWLNNKSIQVCSPSELRHDFFSKKKQKFMSGRLSLRKRKESLENLSSFKLTSFSEETQETWKFQCSSPEIKLKLNSKLFKSRAKLPEGKPNSGTKEGKTCKKLNTSLDYEMEDQETQESHRGISEVSLDRSLKMCFQ